MAAPNLLASTSIYGNTSTTNLSTTSATSLVNNAAASGKTFKVNTVTASNYSTSAVSITVNMYSAASLGGTAYPIAYQISVPANASLIVVDKTTAMYMLENTSLGATAGTANAVVMLASWDEIS